MEKIIEKLEKITDNRRQWGNIRHKLVDIVFIGLVYGHLRRDRFRTHGGYRARKV